MSHKHNMVPIILEISNYILQTCNLASDLQNMAQTGDCLGNCISHEVSKDINLQ